MYNLRKLFNDDSSEQRTKVIGLYALIVSFNIFAWIWASIIFSGNKSLLAVAFLAYIFGLRHGMDTDHIAAIDNVVLKLVREKKHPIATGLFFSLGHSMLVILAVAVIAYTTTAFQSTINAFHKTGGIIATSISAFFLLTIAIMNFMILINIWTSLKQARAGNSVYEENLDTLLASRGFFARIFHPLIRLISRSWHMFAIGFLFGLGFDTATEIWLFAVSATNAAQGMSLWSVMIFPILFTAGMVLIDTTNSILMVSAYSWAFINPIRKLWYNLIGYNFILTGISVLVAFLVGSIEVLGLLVNKLKLKGGIWEVVSKINDSLDKFGFVIVGVLIVVWLLSVIIFRLRLSPGRSPYLSDSKPS